MDSTIWNRFRFRHDDIVIANWGKSGCTWVQQIVHQLVFKGQARSGVAVVSPWVELVFPSQEAKLATLEAQTHRRFVKTHLPVDALVFSQHAKYLYIGRDGRDVAFSLFNHMGQLNDTWYRIMRCTRGEYGELPNEPPTDFRAFFHRWLEDGYPFWPFWSHVASWWNVRGLPNVLLLHFAELKKDLPAAIRRIETFLGIPVDPGLLPDIVNRCSFSYMRDNAEDLLGDCRLIFRGGAQSFFKSGRNAGWRGALDEKDLERYEAFCDRFLARECAEWLESGHVRQSADSSAGCLDSVPVTR